MSAAAYNQGMRRRESFFRITEDTAHTPNESNTTPSPTTEPMNGVRANSSMTRDAEQVRRMMDAAKTGNEARIDWSSRMTDEQIAELSADNPPKPRIAEGPSLQRESIPFPDLGLPVRQSPPDSVANHTQQVTEPSQPAQTECEIVQSEVTHSRPSIAEPENQLQSELVAVPATNPAITAEISAEEIAPEPLVSADVSPASPANVLLETTTDTQLEPATVATPTVTPIPEYEANHTAEPVAEATPVESTPAVSPRTIDPSQYRRAEQHIVDQAAEVVEKSAKNGHQKMTVELPTAANYPYQQVTPVAHAKTIIEDKKQESLFIGRPKRERRRIGKVALSTVVALGALTGLGLYAGGADLVSTWFTHRPEGPQAANKLHPELHRPPRFLLCRLLSSLSLGKLRTLRSSVAAAIPGLLLRHQLPECQRLAGEKQAILWLQILRHRHRFGQPRIRCNHIQSCNRPKNQPLLPRLLQQRQQPRHPE